MQYKTKAPCTKDCPNRSSGCHGKCEKYKEYEKKHREEIEEVAMMKKKRREYSEWHDQIYQKSRRSHR